jgi:hypothetical protein
MRARITKRLVDGLKLEPITMSSIPTQLVSPCGSARLAACRTFVQYKAGSGRGAPARRVTFGGVGKMAPESRRPWAHRQTRLGRDEPRQGDAAGCRSLALVAARNSGSSKSCAGDAQRSLWFRGKSRICLRGI